MGSDRNILKHPLRLFELAMAREHTLDLVHTDAAEPTQNERVTERLRVTIELFHLRCKILPEDEQETWYWLLLS